MNFFSRARWHGAHGAAGGWWGSVRATRRLRRDRGGDCVGNGGARGALVEPRRERASRPLALSGTVLACCGLLRAVAHLRGVRGSGQSLEGQASRPAPPLMQSSGATPARSAKVGCGWGRTRGVGHVNVSLPRCVYYCSVLVGLSCISSH